MPKKWGPAEHEEFLKHILSTHKIDYSLVAKAYGASGPTAGALTQHVDKWMKSMGAKSQNGTPSKAAVTPRKPSTAIFARTAIPQKTSTSIKKRKLEAMSDEDDDEPDMSGGVGARTLLPRRSKSAASSSPALRAAFAGNDDEDESGAGEDDSDVLNLGAANSRFDSGKDHKLDSDAESDISDFEKTLL